MTSRFNLYPKRETVLPETALARISQASVRAPGAQGAGPSALLITVGYSIISLSLMLLHATVGGMAVINSTHIALQLGLAFVAVATLAALHSAQRLHHTSSPVRSDVHSRDAIVQRVRIAEASLEGVFRACQNPTLLPVLQAVRTLRDTLARGLPAQLPSHQSANLDWLAERVDAVCVRCEGITATLSESMSAEIVGDLERHVAEITALSRWNQS